jgi:hypothetical protein
MTASEAAVLSNGVQDLLAAEGRHEQIKHDHQRLRTRAQQFQVLSPIGGLQHRVPLLFKEQAQGLAQEFVALSDQDWGGRGSRAHGRIAVHRPGRLKWHEHRLRFLGARHGWNASEPAPPPALPV